MFRPFVCVVAVAGVLGAGLHAQTPPSPRSGFQVSTTAVVVDVVVRDAKGRPITDLKASDFELLEDDVRQRIASVELIAPGRVPPKSGTDARAREAAEPTPPPTADAPAAEAARPTVIALVFHRL